MMEAASFCNPDSEYPSIEELRKLQSVVPSYTTECSHWSAEFWYEYEEYIGCCLCWKFGEDWDDLNLQEIEEFGGGYICLIHDFPRNTSISERLKCQ